MEDSPNTRETSPRKPRAGWLRYPIWRVATALAVAVPADVLFSIFTLVPMITIPIDLAVAGMLWLILGRPKLLFGVLLLEAIPGVGLLPLWTLVVGAISVLGMVPGRSLGDPQTDPSSALATAARSVLAASDGGTRKN